MVRLRLCPLTASRKCSPSSVQKVESATTRTVAVRGTSRRSAISPTNAGASSTFGPLGRSISIVPSAQDVEAVAAVARRRRASSRQGARRARARPRAPPSAGAAARRGTGTVAIAASCSSGTTAPASIDASARRMTIESTGRIAPATASVQRASDEVEEQRRQHGADAETADGGRLDEAEHAAGDRRGGGPLDQRHRRDVDDAVADPEQAERDDRRPGARQRGERDERGAEAGEPEPEVGGCALAADERERDERADDGADARRRLQEADAGVAEVEELERDDDDQHAVGARHERLRAVEADHDAQARLAPDGAEAGGDPARAPRARAPAGVAAARPSGCARRTRRSRGRWRTRPRRRAWGRRPRRAARRPPGRRRRRCCRTCSR